MTALVLNASCLEEPPGSGYDVVITDPPYSPHVHASATSQSAGGGTRARDLGFGHLSDELRAHVAALVAGAARWSVVYSDVESSHVLREDAEHAGAEYVRTMPWIRWSMPQLSGDRPPQGFEHMLVFHGQDRGTRGGLKPRAKHWNGAGNLTHLAHLALRDDQKHKCEKPLDQALDLVLWFSDDGETVLDPCAGSGVFGLACALLGRDYVGYEIDPAWAKRANALISGPGARAPRYRDRFKRWHESTEAEAAATLAGAFTEPAKARAAIRRQAAIDALDRATGVL